MSPTAGTVPVRLTVNACELETPPFVTVTVMTSAALSGAAEVDGVKVTLTVQGAPAAMLAPQVLEGEAKSALLVPVKVMLPPEKGMGLPVLFVSVTVFAVVVTPKG